MMRMTFAVAAILTLAACGGGGGSGTGGTTSGGSTGTEPPSSALSLLEKWRRFENGIPTLSMTEADLRRELRTASERLTHARAGEAEILVPTDSQDYLGEEYDSYSDLLDWYFSTVTAAAPVMTHDGVRIAETREKVGEDGAILRYWGWLEHTGFWVGHDDYDTFSHFGAYYTGTDPTGSGSATWNGVMVGMEGGYPADGAPDMVLGDARITIDNLASPNVDVVFANIVNATEGTSRNDISWRDLALDRGVFKSPIQQYGDYIIGSINGPRHQEAGGSFAKDGITGAFGAKRE